MFRCFGVFGGLGLVEDLFAVLVEDLPGTLLTFVNFGRLVVAGGSAST